MKEIFVSHSKDDKSIAKKLVSKIESKGISCYIYSRDKNTGSEEELISDSNIFIIILSKSSRNSQELIKQIKIAVENELHIIPIKTGEIESSLTMEYFLYSLEWVDVHGDGFDEAFEILIEIIEELNEGRPIIKTPKKKKSDSSDSFKLKQSHLIGIISVFAVIIVYLIFFNNGDKGQTSDTNNSNITNKIDPPDYVYSELKEDEKIVVGSWRMVDYEDSRIMSPEEQALTAQNVEEMKKQVLLKYNSNRTFERTGFTEQVQKGYWEYDSNKRKIYLTPENVNQREEINILNLTDKLMTIVVSETIQDPQGKTETVTTKITFQKQ